MALEQHQVRLTNYVGYLSCEGVIVIINNSYSYNKRELASKIKRKKHYSYCVGALYLKLGPQITSPPLCRVYRGSCEFDSIFIVLLHLKVRYFKLFYFFCSHCGHSSDCDRRSKRVVIFMIRPSYYLLFSHVR